VPFWMKPPGAWSPWRPSGRVAAEAVAAIVEDDEHAHQECSRACFVVNTPPQACLAVCTTGQTDLSRKG
jgi:hypothetical protein